MTTQEEFLKKFRETFPDARIIEHSESHRTQPVGKYGIKGRLYDETEVCLCFSIAFDDLKGVYI